MLEQRIGCIYRLGQSEPTDGYNLVSEEGIEARITTLFAQMKAVFCSLFDGSTDEVRFEGSASFLESVRRIVEPIEVPVGGAEPEAEGSTVVATEKPTAAPETVQEVPIEPTVTKHPDGSLRIDVSPALAGPLPASLRGSAQAPIS